MVAESVKTAVDQATERLLMAVDQRIAVARSSPSPSTHTQSSRPDGKRCLRYKQTAGLVGCTINKLI